MYEYIKGKESISEFSFGMRLIEELILSELFELLVMLMLYEIYLPVELIIPRVEGEYLFLYDLGCDLIL